MDLKLRCSASGCGCKSFCAAGDTAESLRVCDSCSHTWITHLLEKLMTAAEDQLTVFDVCSLALYGTHALPIRLKIVIERLLTTLSADDIEKIRRNFGWTLQDLARGYMVQDPRGGLISRWSLLPVEEELIILQQFLRFPVTKSISLALIKEDFPMVSVNNNLLPNNNNNHSPPTPTSNGVNGKSYQNQKVQPPSSPQSISPLHQLTSALGISTNKHHNQNQLVSGLSSSLPVAAGLKMRSTSHHNYQGHPDSGSLLTTTSSPSSRPTGGSALNLSLSGQNSSDDSEPEREFYERARKHETFSPHHRRAHSHQLPDSVMDLSVKPGNNNSTPSNNSNAAAAALLKSRGMTVSQALKSVRGGGSASGGSGSPKAGQNPPSFEDNFNQTLGLMGMGMNMSALLNNLGNIKSTDLMAAAAAQQFLSSVTASLQHQQQQVHQIQQKKTSLSAHSGQTSSSGSTSPGIGTNNNGNTLSSKLSPNTHTGGKQQHHQQQQENMGMRSQDRHSQSQAQNHNQSPGSGSHKKSSSAGKRAWNPLPAPVAMATHLVNPATGKRRVQCAVCLKTFCDKGALKIHFSAVHLREMHKCTVSGCSMMFSSRRSRNRHSANPNPKLHSPHIRRKISPHDGRTAGPALNLNSPTLMLPPGIRYPGFMSTSGLPGNPGEDEDYIDAEDHSFSGDEEDEDFPESRMIKMDKEEGVPDDSYMSDEGSFSSNNEDSSPTKFSPETMLAQGHGQPQVTADGARKRKRNNPVRLPSVPDDSNDEFCCYDDGTVINEEEDGTKTDSPKRFKESGIEDTDKSQLSPEDEEHSPSALDLAKSSPTPPTSPKDDKEESSCYRDNEQKYNHTQQQENDKESHKSRDQEDVDHLSRIQSLPIFSKAPGDGENDSEVSSELGKSDDDEENTGRSIGSPNSSNGYIDRENPKKCSACGKEFQNQFGVKTHYQNVHLKLMHKCTVTSCTAAFPSKRSRDRHSSNLNLHRKLLSTSPTPRDDYLPGIGSQSPRSPSPSSTGSTSPDPGRGSRPGGVGGSLNNGGIRRPGGEIDFITTTTTATALSGGGNHSHQGLSIFNPYIFRSNLLLENSLYIN